MEENSFTKQQTTLKKKWYKTRAGIVFLSVVGIITLSITVFAGMVGYYAWQIKYGDADQLAKQFSTEKFSQDPNLVSTSIENLEQKDVKNYIKDFNPILADGTKPITIVTFIDFECPFCQQSYPVFKQVISQYEPLVKVVFKHLPLENLHPGAVLSATAATCADEQNKFWEYYDALFLNTDHGQTNLINLAGQINLNTQTFSTCLKSNKYQKNINQDLMDAVDLGLIGTPTYFVNGYKIEGGLTKDEWDKIILQVYNN